MRGVLLFALARQKKKRNHHLGVKNGTMKRSPTWDAFSTYFTTISSFEVDGVPHSMPGHVTSANQGSSQSLYTHKKIASSIQQGARMIRSASFHRLQAIRKARMHSREALLWCIVLLMVVSMMKRDGSLHSSPFGVFDVFFFGSQSPSPGEPPHRHAYLPDPEVLRHSPTDVCGDVLGIPKVALLFLTTGQLYHEETWRLWLTSAEGKVPSNVVLDRICGINSEYTSRREEQERLEEYRKACLEGYSKTMQGDEQNVNDLEYRKQHLFSIYVHAPPSFRNQFHPKSLWHGKMVRYRVETEWGAHTLVEATRHLLWEAFRDPLNTRFLLLSESDIPIYDPLTMYQQLQAEDTSRLDTCIHDAISPWRWHPNMETKRLKFHHWRKSPQWMALTRDHAKLALEDREVYRMFERHCWSAWDEEHSRWHRDCFSDEHYFATLLATHDRDSEGVCESRGVSFTLWESKSAHPKAFSDKEITAELIHKARSAPKSLSSGQLLPECRWQEAQMQAQSLFIPLEEALDEESRDNICSSLDSKKPVFDAKLPSTCFLTARKFKRDSAFAVKKLFLRCDEDVHLISRDACLKEGGTVCNSIWGHFKTIFYKDAC